jgi:SAM-dependent methyltransferase
VWNIAGHRCAPGQRALDVGCGTGEDAIWLARRGVAVVATDTSTNMLQCARRKARQAGLAGRIQFVQGDAASLAVDGAYDAALSNFGALNCVPDRRAFGQALAARLRPGAHLVAVVMGPVCLWELGWHLAHGDARRAICRWRSGQPAPVGRGSVAVWYPSPRRLAADLGPHFDLRQLVGVGALVPPSYLWHLVDRWPRAFDLLAGVDSRVPFGPWVAEHYVAVFERR